jgi:hypothetical protein
VQLLILYQLATAKAAIALGGESHRTGEKQLPDNTPRQHAAEQEQKDHHARQEAEAAKASAKEEAPA